MLLEDIEKKDDDVFGITDRLFPRFSTFLENKIRGIKLVGQSCDFYVETTLECRACRTTRGFDTCFVGVEFDHEVVCHAADERRVLGRKGRTRDGDGIPPSSLM